MSRKLYITGTDTGIGKTYISVNLLHAFNQAGLSTIGLKPIATGANPENEDALLLQQAASIKLPYADVNPLAFAPPIAPHIAAAAVNTTLTIDSLNKCMESAFAHPADIHLIEGVGGSHVPLNRHETMADWARVNNFETILVVGVRLGCINHALITLRALQADKVNVIGWIANCIDEGMDAMQENLQALRELLNVPCLAVCHKGGPVKL